jgi:hypothetical protein
MSAAWIAALVLGTSVIGGIAKLVMGGMIREEAQTRLGRIPYAVIQLATARVAPELRDDLVAEWRAELEFLLTDTEGMPLTRLVRGIRYSAGLLVSARAITDGLTRGGGGRVLRWVPVVVFGADALLLLYFFSSVTNVNWSSPLSAALVYAAELAVMISGMSFEIVRFTGDRLQRYKDYTGAIPLRGLDKATTASMMLAFGVMAALAALMFLRMRVDVISALGPAAGGTAIIIALVTALTCVLSNTLVLAIYALGTGGDLHRNRIAR